LSAHTDVRAPGSPRRAGWRARPARHPMFGATQARIPLQAHVSCPCPDAKMWFLLSAAPGRAVLLSVRILFSGEDSDHGGPSAGSARNQRRALGSAAKGLRLGSAVALLRGVTFAPQLGQRPPPVECARQSPAFCGTPTPLSSARMARAQPASQSGVAVARPGGRPCHTHSTWRRSRAPRQHWGTDGAQRLRRAARAETCQENEVLTDSSTEVTDME
jgi:hypothetical protein